MSSIDPEKIEDYQVVRASGKVGDVFDELRSKVMVRVQDGWKPIGGIDTDMSGGYQNNFVAQAMVKIDEDEKKLLNE